MPRTEYEVAFWIYLLGLAIVFFSHLWLLSKSVKDLTQSDLENHAWLNLFAVLLLAGGWWMKNKKTDKIVQVADEDESLSNKVAHGVTRGAEDARNNLRQLYAQLMD